MDTGLYCNCRGIQVDVAMKIIIQTPIAAINSEEITPPAISAEEIPLESRTLSVLDAYNAMISDRQYRKALGKEKAIQELKDCAGTQFDPIVVKEFIHVLNEFEKQEAEKGEEQVDQETVRMGDQWI
jgi:HD-GYP domain-containing protein (c-di-GMP phosphodiesterase class II)